MVVTDSLVWELYDIAYLSVLVELIAYGKETGAGNELRVSASSHLSWLAINPPYVV